jgi:ubiquinone/menaquinone biosynthesis C-methylase UbiE
MLVTSLDRWKKAQIFEQLFWKAAAQRIRDGARPPLTYHKWRSENLMEMLNKAFPGERRSFSQARVLEVGSGPVGAIAFMDASERFAIDPLCDFYSTQPELVEHRSPDVRYEISRGEELRFEDSSMDLVIIENVIDHVQNADRVMAEIYRVLKADGILYLTVNVHPAWGSFLHEILARTRIDRGHPHTFTFKRIAEFLIHHGYIIKYCTSEGYRDCRRKYLQSPDLKYKIIGAIGLSEFLYTSVSVKA